MGEVRKDEMMGEVARLGAQVSMRDPAIASVVHDTDVDCLSPLESFSELFPNDILYGNVEPAIFQVGTAADIYEGCWKAIEIEMRHKPDFTLAPGCEMLLRVKPHNVWQMTKAVNDFGWFVAHQLGLVPSSTEIDGG